MDEFALLIDMRMYLGTLSTGLKLVDHCAPDDAVTHSNNFIQAAQEVPYGDITINRGAFL